MSVPEFRRMRFSAAFLCVFLILLCMPMLGYAYDEYDYEGDMGDVRWVYHPSIYKLEMSLKPNGTTAYIKMPTNVIRDEVQTIEIYGAVTVLESGFKNCPALEEVNFHGIAEHGLMNAYTFQNCTSLKTVYLHTDCTIIGNNAFDGCTALEKIEMAEESLVEKWQIKEIRTQAFRNCRSLPDTVVNSLFNNRVDSEVQEYSLETIGPYAFEGCTRLMVARIPQWVRSLSQYAFKDCTNLDTVRFECATTINIDGVQQYVGVEKIGVGVFSGCTKLDTVELPKSLITLETEDSFTHSAGDGAFKGCTALEEIQLPENLSGTMADVFRGCTGLKRVNIPAGVKELYYTFADCTSLEDVTFAEGLERIAGGFWGCTALQGIQLPSTVTDLDYAFSGCTKLNEVNLSSGVVYMSNAFEGCTGLQQIELPETILYIRSAFRGCTALASIELPAGVVDLYGAFFGCTKIRSIVIPDGFTGNGDYRYRGKNFTASMASAFENCTSLNSASLSSSLEAIGSNAFKSCTALTGITVPGHVAEIGVGAFEDCTTLTGITLPGCVASIGAHAFRGCTKLGSVAFAAGVEGYAAAMTIGSQAFENCSSLTAFSFPKGLKKIESNAFENTALQTADLSAVVTGEAIISTYAFSNCKSLKTAVIGNGFKVIDYRAFEGCSNLEALTLGEGVKRIGERAFSGTKLTDVTFPAGLEQIGQYAMPTLRHAGFKGRGACPTFQNYAFWYSPSSVTVQCHRASAIETWAKGKGFKIEYWGTSLELPTSLQRVEDNAFVGIAVESIVVPKNVTYIGHQAFSNLSAEDTVTVVIEADSVTIERDAFQGSTVLIQAPAGFAYSADDFEGAAVTIKIQ